MRIQGLIGRTPPPPPPRLLLGVALITGMAFRHSNFTRTVQVRWRTTGEHPIRAVNRWCRGKVAADDESMDVFHFISPRLARLG